MHLFPKPRLGGGLCNCHFVFYEHWPLPFNLSSHSSIPPLPQAILRTLRAPRTRPSSFHACISLSFFPCCMSLKCSFHNFGSVFTKHLLCVGTVVGLEIQWRSWPQSRCWSRQWWEAVMEWIFESRAGASQVMSGCGCAWVKGISGKEQPLQNCRVC